MMVGHGISNFLVCRGILGYYSGFMSSLICLLVEHVIQNVDIGGITTQRVDDWVLLIVHFAFYRPSSFSNLSFLDLGQWRSSKINSRDSRKKTDDRKQNEQSTTPIHQRSGW
jgi:hypothetical protein